jgi:hypothetical protein
MGTSIKTSNKLSVQSCKRIQSDDTLGQEIFALDNLHEKGNFFHPGQLKLHMNILLLSAFNLVL